MHDSAVPAGLVGRAKELDEIGALLDKAAAGEPRFLLVGGDAGIGKTALVDEAGMPPKRGGSWCSRAPASTSAPTYPSMPSSRRCDLSSRAPGNSPPTRRPRV